MRLLNNDLCRLTGKQELAPNIALVLENFKMVGCLLDQRERETTFFQYHRDTKRREFFFIIVLLNLTN